MSVRTLIDTTRALVANDNGSAAMEEDNPTCDGRLARLGIPETEAAGAPIGERSLPPPGLGGCMALEIWRGSDDGLPGDTDSVSQILLRQRADLTTGA